MSMTDTTRQDALLEGLADYVEASAAIGALIVVGSFAAGTADAVSDLDVFFPTYPGRFEDAWNHRRDLHITGSVIEWDVLDEQRDVVAGHYWLSPDLVLVEAVISEPDGGGKLAEPFTFVRGDPELLEQFPRRGPIDASEMTAAGHPVDVAYDALKRAVRDAAASRLPRSESS